MASMKAASRQRERGAYPTHASHAHTPSVSSTTSSVDDHHVTDTFSDLYGNMDDNTPAYDDSRLRDYRMSMQKYGVPPRLGNGSTTSSDGSTGSSTLNPTTPPNNRVQRRSMLGQSSGEPLSPVGSPTTIKAPPNSPSLSDAANASFPLNDIDYESNPAAVAQELSNLQALRRMSMDVSNSPTNDPDLPAFSFIPTVAPKQSDDDNDASRLFWVPARLHPELAPKEFKSFVESRVQQIRHQEEGGGAGGGGGGGGLSPDSGSPQSGPSLRRKKSILSRQIDNTGGKGADNYEDGADLLSRQRSITGQQDPQLKVADIQEALTSQDPTHMMKKLSLSRTEAALTGEPSQLDDDMPILPAAPPGSALRRSTRTALRRGSLRKGERVPPGRRGNARPSTGDGESPLNSPVEKEFKLNRVRTEPIPSISVSDEDPPIPKRLITETISLGDGASRTHRKDIPSPLPSPSPSSASTKSKTPSPPQSPNSERAVTPPDTSSPPPKQDYISFSKPAPRAQQEQQQIPSRKGIPERGSSREAPAMMQQAAAAVTSVSTPATPAPVQTPPPEGQKRPQLKRTSPLPSSDNVRTDGTGPPIEAYARARRKSSESAISSSGSLSSRDKDKDPSRKPSWGWLLGSSEDKEKEKVKQGKKVRRVKSTEKTNEREDERREKEREREREKSGEHARLDLLQKSIDAKPVRESMESTASAEQRPSVDALEREREKEKEKAKSKSTAVEPPKKEGGLLSSIFGGSKKKSSGETAASKQKEKSEKPEKSVTSPEKESGDKQANQQPYYYTRFPIHIERAIYRLSHLKLANPRRPLHQQVLLSNFMYAYLAKVQMMQPQNQQLQQAAQAAQQRQAQQQQKRDEEEQKRRQRQQQRERQQMEEEARRRAEEESLFRAEQPQPPNGNHATVDQSDEDYDFDDDGTEGYPDSPHHQYSRSAQQPGYSNHQQQQQYDYSNGYYDDNGQQGGQQQQYYYGERGSSRGGAAGGGAGYESQQQYQYQQQQQQEYYRQQQQAAGNGGGGGAGGGRGGGQEVQRGRQTQREEEYDDDMW